MSHVSARNEYSINDFNVFFNILNDIISIKYIRKQLHSTASTRVLHYSLYTLESNYIDSVYSS